MCKGWAPPVDMSFTSIMFNDVKANAVGGWNGGCSNLPGKKSIWFQLPSYHTYDVKANAVVEMVVVQIYQVGKPVKQRRDLGFVTKNLKQEMVKHFSSWWFLLLFTFLSAMIVGSYWLY